MRGSDETTQSSEASEGEKRRRLLTLRAVLPDSSLSRTLSGARLVLGRDETADVVVTGSKVSRRHAEIYRQGPLFALRDLGSTNGTFVDGRRTQHCALRSGLVLRMGEWLGLISELEPAELDVGFGELAAGLFGGAELGRASGLVARLAPSSLPVSLVGATGTGKELFARALHQQSNLSGPFYALNCAALPHELADGELFGYRKGAFTGAERAHDGHLRAASGGTLFLDEVSELPLALQAKLLRALELGEVMPLGEMRPMPFRARLVCASQRPLRDFVERGSFREDLAARLCGAEIVLPNLADRVGDVPRLFHRFVSDLSGGRAPRIPTAVYERLCLHRWPQNVRELQLLARRLLAEHPLEPAWHVEHLPQVFQDLLPREAEPASQAAVGESRREHDLRRLMRALEATGGNVTLAAGMAGISRQRAYRLMEQADERASTVLGDESNGSGS